MTNKLVLENLKHQPMRSVLSALLIGVPVTLILSLVGLSHGMLEDAAQRTRGIGADVIVKPKGSTQLSLRNGISQGYVDYFARQAHVKIATGVLIQPVEGGITLNIFGIDLKQYTAMTGGFAYVKGGPLQLPDDILVDEYYANEKRASVGGSITVLNRPWRVAGIIRSGQMARLVVALNVLQDLTGNSHTVSMIYLKLDSPANTDKVVNELKSKPELEGWPIMSTEELASMWSVSNMPGLSAFIAVVMGIGVVIGFFVVSLSMYMAVLQRTREIGILKSLGASKPFILRLVLIEAVLLGVGGTVIGVILSFGAYYLIGVLVPASIQMKIVPEWWPIAGGITLVGAILGALYPGMNAARRDPIEALAYE